jgi:hypothetical protein
LTFVNAALLLRYIHETTFPKPLNLPKIPLKNYALTYPQTPWLTTVFVLVIRFVIWPVVSIASIYLLVKDSTILGSDPMLWFTMMLMPTGPPAMKLITMVEVSDADEEDEHKIAKLLTVSYLFLFCLSHDAEKMGSSGVDYHASDVICLRRVSAADT